jgi:hypothetical protein
MKNATMKHPMIRLVLLLLLAGAAALPAQESDAEDAKLLALRKEQHQKFAEASAQARQEEVIAKAFEAATKAYQDADLKLLQRVKQIDPSLAEFINERIRRYHGSAAGKPQ